MTDMIPIFALLRIRTHEEKDPLRVGDLLGPATPLPIPNREVKRSKTDDTYWFAGRESRFRQHARGFDFGIHPDPPGGGKVRISKSCPREAAATRTFV